MKLRILFLPLLILSSSFLGGCSSSTSKLKPTFGSVIDETYKDITYSELYKRNLENEQMIVFTYPGKDTHCSCWKTLQNVLLPKLAKESEYLIYAVDAYEFLGKDEQYNLVLDFESPSIVFFKDGKKFDQYIYSIRNTQDFFKNYEALLNFLNEKTIAPNYIYTSVSGLKEGIKNSEEYIIHYTYHSCPDCSYCLPNVLYPYLAKNNLNKKIHIVDLENEISFQDDGKFNSKKEEYVNFKKEMGLSKEGNATFGYEGGFVPTIQYYKNGILSDASVFFNDTISLVGNEYKITQSFYSEERVNSLKYLDNVKTKVLEGLTIPLEELTIYEDYDYIAWNQDAANKYHKPLLEAFLNTYAK